MMKKLISFLLLAVLTASLLGGCLFRHTRHRYTIEVEGTRIEPTCEHGGSVLWECRNRRCEETYTERLPALGHIYSTFFVMRQASRDEDGFGVYLCACGKPELHTIVIPKLRS